MAHHEHCCELHDWKPVGEVGTGNGTLALVAPYFATTLGDWWNDYLTLPTEDRRPDDWQVKQLDLRQMTTKHDGHSYQDREAALLIPCDNGTYDVEARFCDLYGDGHLLPCELRVDLHRYWHEQERRDALRDHATAQAAGDPDPDDGGGQAPIDTAEAWQDLVTADDLAEASRETGEWVQARVAQVHTSALRSLDGIAARAGQLGIDWPPVATSPPDPGA
jgi:hypothetical protein